MDKYYEYIFKISSRDEEKIIDDFINFGFNTFYIEYDVNTSEIFLRVYFKTEEQIKYITDLLSKYDLQLVSNSITEEKKWLEKWVKSLNVFEFVDGIWVNPFENKKIEKPGLVLNIIPGSAFGTGLHPTTRLPAKLLMEIGCENKDVLDVGTGSGILSILAKKMGAKNVVALDNDILAIEKAKETANLNKSNIDIRESDFLQAISENERFDILISNIVAEVLIDLMNDLKFKSVLKENAYVIFSGIIQSKEELVIKHAEKIGLSLKERMEDGSWIALLFQKKN